MNDYATALTDGGNPQYSPNWSVQLAIRLVYQMPLTSGGSASAGVSPRRGIDRFDWLRDLGESGQSSARQRANLFPHFGVELDFAGHLQAQLILELMPRGASGGQLARFERARGPGKHSSMGGRVGLGELRCAAPPVQRPLEFRETVRVARSIESAPILLVELRALLIEGRRADLGRRRVGERRPSFSLQRATRTMVADFPGPVIRVPHDRSTGDRDCAEFHARSWRAGDTFAPPRPRHPG